jgi:hypothetical protein
VEVTDGLVKLHNVEVSDFLLITSCYSGDKIKEGEICRTCGTPGGKEKLVHNFGAET